MNKEYENNDMWHYLLKHNYISEYKKITQQEELSIERAECIANKYRTLIEEKDKQLDKYKNVIDKIKEKLKEDLKYGRSKDHLWLMGYYDACKDINKLLEEVE